METLSKNVLAGFLDLTMFAVTMRTTISAFIFTLSRIVSIFHSCALHSCPKPVASATLIYAYEIRGTMGKNFHPYVWLYHFLTFSSRTVYMYAKGCGTGKLTINLAIGAARPASSRISYRKEPVRRAVNSVI
jgi:hypothetical protein